MIHSPDVGYEGAVMLVAVGTFWFSSTGIT